MRRRFLLLPNRAYASSSFCDSYLSSQQQQEAHPLIKGISKLLRQPSETQFAAPDLQKFYNKKNNPTLLCVQRLRRLKKRQPEEMKPTQYLFLMSQWTKGGGGNIGHPMFEQMIKVGVGPEHAYSTMIKHYIIQARSAQDKGEDPEKCVLEALGYLHSMREKGITPGGSAYEPLAGWFLENNQKAAFEEILGWMKADGPACYTALFKVFGAQGMVEDAYEYFQSLDASEEIQSDYVAAYVRGFSIKHPAPKTVEQFRHVVEKLHVKPGVDAYRILISQCCREGLIHLALDLIQEAHDRGIELNAALFQPLLVVLVEGAQQPAALEYYAAMLRMGVQPSFDTFNCLIRVCAKANDVEKMFELIEEMKKLGIRRSSEIYNAVIQVFGKAKRFNKALEILREMEDDNIQPDSMTYTELISASPDHKVAWKLFKKMKLQGLPATDTVLSQLFTSMVKDGALDQALEMLRDSDACRIGLAAKSALLAGLANGRRVDEALLCYEDIKSEGKLPEPYAYGSLIEALGYAGKLDKMFELFDLSFGSQCWRKRDDSFVEEQQIKCCIYITKACILHNDLSRLERFLLKAKQSDYFDQNALFDTIILAIAGGGDLRAAWLNFSWSDGFALLELMHKVQIPVSRTFFEALLEGCVVLKDVNRAEAVVEEMESQSLQPNILTFIRLLRLYIAVGDADKTALMLQQMRSSLRDEDIFLMVGEVLSTAQPAMQKHVFQLLSDVTAKPLENP